MKTKILCAALCFLLAGCSGGSPTGSATPGHSHGSGHSHGDGHKHDDQGQEEHHHDEGQVELSREQAAQIGLKTQQPSHGEIARLIRASGQVSGDPDREVKVSAPVAGIVSRLDARVGDSVRPGQSLATVDSPEISQHKASYHSARLEEELAIKNVQRRTTLARLSDSTRAPLEDARKQLAEARAEADAAKAASELASSQLKRYESLLKDGIASLQQVEEARAKDRQTAAQQRKAQTQLALARSHLDREERIGKSGLLYSGEVWEAENARARAEHAAHHAREQLEVVGANPDSDDSTLLLKAPIRGWVTERKVARGERVSQGQVLFTLLDTSRLWVWIDLPESDAALVEVGTRVRIYPSGRRQDSVEARITYLSPSVESESRSVRARCEVAGGVLRPNTFVEVELALGGSRKHEALLVPAAAVTEVEGKDVVYVREDQHHFRRRVVRKGSLEGGQVEIVEGLKASDEVVVEGVFALKSQDLKSALEAGHSH